MNPKKRRTHWNQIPKSQMISIRSREKEETKLIRIGNLGKAAINYDIVEKNKNDVGKEAIQETNKKLLDGSPKATVVDVGNREKEETKRIIKSVTSAKLPCLIFIPSFSRINT
jgi:uncharacterized protein YabE (DUF348 family)